MARGTWLTEGERHEIVRLFDEGLSCAQIAARAGRSRDTVSRVCRAEGREFDREPTRKAVEAAQLDNRARRATLAAELLEDLARVRRELFAPSLLAAVSVRGEAVVKKLPAVLARDLRDRAAAIAQLANTHLRLVTVDSAADYSSVDAWLVHVTGVNES